MLASLRSFLIMAAVLTPTPFFSAASLAQPSAAGGQKAAASEGFEKLRALAGTWTFTTAAQEGTVAYELVSNGTAILERVMNDEHGKAGMVSVIYLEGDRLVLQHYCSAGNQPRLVSTGLEGSEIRFTFDRAANLPSLDAGHIHAAVFAFPDVGTFTSRWTWRAGGVETTDTRHHTRAK